jgi:hypothetical protein
MPFQLGLVTRAYPHHTTAGQEVGDIQGPPTVYVHTSGGEGGVERVCPVGIPPSLPDPANLESGYRWVDMGCVCVLKHISAWPAHGSSD